MTAEEVSTVSLRRFSLRNTQLTVCLSQAEMDFGDNVERSIFEQILDMDEEDDREFSRSIVFGFLDQAEQTFAKMDVAM